MNTFSSVIFGKHTFKTETNMKNKGLLGDYIVSFNRYVETFNTKQIIKLQSNELNVMNNNNIIYIHKHPYFINIHTNVGI